MRCTINEEIILIFGLISTGSILANGLSLPIKKSPRPLSDYLEALIDYLSIDTDNLGHAPGWVARQVDNLSYVDYKTIAGFEAQVSGGDFSGLKNESILSDDSTRKSTIKLLHALSKYTFTDKPDECKLYEIKFIIRSLDAVIPIMDTFVEPRDSPVLKAKYETQHYQTFYTLCINLLSRLTQHCVSQIKQNFDNFLQMYQTNVQTIEHTIYHSTLHGFNRLKYINKDVEKSLTIEASRLDDIPKRAAVDAAIDVSILRDADREERSIEDNAKLFVEQACSTISNETFSSIGVYNLAKAMRLKFEEQSSQLFNKIREYTRLCQNYILDERARARGL